MVRLNFVVEGHSEEAFVNQILVPHLAELGVYGSARRVATSRRGRGGLRRWQKAAQDMQRWMREDRGADARFTTMFDFYGLPADTPGQTAAKGERDPFAKVYAIETAIAAAAGGDTRLLPYIQLFEFEALLFADIARLADFYPNRAKQLIALRKVADSFESPEHIDDGPQTAPSKRIVAQLAEYEGGKRVAAPIVLGRIGLARLRAACRHFGAWLSCLEKLGAPIAPTWPLRITSESSA